MQLTLIRHTFNPSNTIGRVLIDGKFFCHSLEDVIRNIPPCENKIKGKTAIPYGRYKVIITHSTRFNKELPILLDVPCFEGIRMHSGNTEADTDGCILLGANITTDLKGIFNCSFIVKDITKRILSAKEAWITIKKEFEV